MLEFAQKLYDEEIIPEALLNKIQADEDVNATDAQNKNMLHYLCEKKDVPQEYVKQALVFGIEATKPDRARYSPMMHVILTGRKDLYDLLKTIPNQDYQAVTITSENLVTLALAGDDEEMLQEVLSKVDDPLSGNRFGRTPLHLAARMNYRLIHVLLQDERFQKIKTKEDIFGDTPIDLAAREQHEDAFNALAQSKQNIASHPKYNLPMIDTGQTVLETQIKKYLVNEGRDPQILDKKGLCNGWAFLYQAYLPDRMDEYWDMVEFMASWNGEKESFDKLVLPKSLEKKYAKRGKEGASCPAADLFEQVLNDVLVFFGATDGLYALELGIGQRSRIQQFQLLESMGRSIENVFNLGNITVNENQLIELLEYLRTYPELSVDVGGQQHQISIYITKEGHYRLFDSALPRKIRDLETATEVADIIIKNKYLFFKHIDKYWIELYTYKITKENGPSAIERLLTASDYDFSQSANGFNALHFAVLENNLDKVKALAASHPELLLQANVHNRTPVDLAILNSRSECFELMINSRSFTAEELEVIAKNCAVAGNGAFIGALVKAQPQTDINQLWEKIMDDINLISMEDRYNQAVALLSFAKGKIDLDDNHCNQYPPLMASIRADHKPFFDYLLENKASFLNCDAFSEWSVYSLCLSQEDPYYINKILEIVGDKIDDLDKLGNNLLHWAVLKGKPDVVKACLAKGAKTDVKNKDGQTVLDILEAQPNPEISDLLQAPNATQDKRTALRFSRETEKPLGDTLEKETQKSPSVQRKTKPE